MATNTSESSLSHSKQNKTIIKTWTETEIKTLEISHTWKIRNFSSCSKKTGEYLRSDTFSSDDKDSDKWYLRLYPNGETEDSNDYLSFYLYLKSSKKHSVSAKLTFSMYNAKMEKYGTMQGVHSFDKVTGYGSPKFMQRNLLLAKANELLPNDTLTLFYEIILTENIVNVSGNTEVIPKVKDPSHSLLKNLGHILDAGTLNDVKLVVGQHQFQAHKLILTAHSSVFAAMFKHKMLEQKQNLVDIIDLNPDVVEKMLRFIYTGQVQNIEDMAESLLAAADKYGIESLKLICQEQLNKSLSVQNASHIMILADLHNVDWLKKRAIKFINMNKVEVVNTEGFKSTVISHPHLIAEVFVDSVSQTNADPDMTVQSSKNTQST